MTQPSPGASAMDGLARQLAAAEAAGLDLVWLRPNVGSTALAAAAALGGMTGGLRLAAVVNTGPHPLRIAEEAVVADQCTGGRLVLVLHGERARADVLGESADVVLAATAARPFSHAGPQWRIPARRVENTDVERRVRVTPAPAQLELPIWLAGAGAGPMARERGLSHVSGSEQLGRSASEEWTATEAHLGRAAARLRRPALRRLDAANDGAFDTDALVAGLLSERERWGLDVAILELPASIDDHARERAIADIGRLVRPRVQLDAMPAGLEEHWKLTVAREVTNHEQ